MYHPNFFYNSQQQYFEGYQESHKSNLEILLENFNASQTHSHPNYLSNYQSQHFEETQEFYNPNQTYPQPNFLYDHHNQYFEESPESHKSHLEIIMENFNETSLMTRRFVETQNATPTYFEEPQESYNSNLEALAEDFNATQTYHQPNFLYDHHAQHFEESQDYHKSNLEIIMEDFIEAQTLSRLESMMTKHFEETQNATLAPFEESQESHNFNFETSMEDSDEMLTHSRLEAMMENFVETQTVQNQEFIKQSIQNNETLRQLTTMVESLATHNMALDTQIVQLEQKPLGDLLEEYIGTTISEEQIEMPEESNNEIEESDYEIEESDNVVEEISSEKRVEIEKNPPTLSEREVVEEVERETPIVIPLPYTPPISFPHSFVEAKVDSKSIMYVKILENIHTNAPLFEVLHKKRNLDDMKLRISLVIRG